MVLEPDETGFKGLLKLDIVVRCIGPFLSEISNRCPMFAIQRSRQEVTLIDTGHTSLLCSSIFIEIHLNCLDSGRLFQIDLKPFRIPVAGSNPSGTRFLIHRLFSRIIRQGRRGLHRLALRKQHPTGTELARLRFRTIRQEHGIVTQIGSCIECSGGIETGRIEGNTSFEHVTDRDGIRGDLPIVSCLPDLKETTMTGTSSETSGFVGDRTIGRIPERPRR